MTMKAYKKAPKTQKQINEDYIKDMQENREKAQLQAQYSEFRDWLFHEIEVRLKENTDVPDFLRDMFMKVESGALLTINMENALRKWKTRTEVTNNRENNSIDNKNVPSITIKVRQWFIKELKFDSRILTGKVLAETAKAYLLQGYADMVDDCSWCVRCGKELTEPASMVIGMGAICADKSGVPYPTDILLAPKKERTKIRKALLKKLHAQKFERWIPKSQIEEVLKEEKPSK